MRKPAAKTMLANEAANHNETSSSGENGGLEGDAKGAEMSDSVSEKDHVEKTSEDRVVGKPATKKLPAKGRKNTKAAANTKELHEGDAEIDKPLDGDSAEVHNGNKAEAPQKLSENGNGDTPLESDEKEVQTTKTGKKAISTKSGKNARGTKHEEQGEVAARDETEEMHPSKKDTRATRSGKNGDAKSERVKADETSGQDAETTEPVKAAARTTRGKKNAASQQDKTKQDGGAEEGASAVTQPTKGKGRGRKNAKSKRVDAEQEEMTEQSSDHSATEDSKALEERITEEQQSKGSNDQKPGEQESDADETADAAPQKKGKKPAATQKQTKRAPAKEVQTTVSENKKSEPEKSDVASPQRKRGTRAQTTKQPSSEDVNEAVLTEGNEPHLTHEEEVSAPQKRGKKQPAAKKRKAVQKEAEEESPSKAGEDEASDKAKGKQSKQTDSKADENPAEEETHTASGDEDTNEQSGEDVVVSQGPRKRGKKQEAASSNKRQTAAKETEKKTDGAPTRRAGKRGAAKTSAAKEASPEPADDASEAESDEPESKLPKKKAAKGTATSAAPTAKKSPTKRGKKGAATKQGSDAGPSDDRGDEGEPTQKRSKAQSSGGDADETPEVGTDVEKYQDEGSKPWNLKICSWNVNGIRAWVGKGGLDYVKSENPDILTLQETKCTESKVPKEVKELEDYHSYFLSGDQDGYSGVGLLSKAKPLEVKYGIGMEQHDKEGRVITAEYDKFFLVATYVPNAGKKLVRLEYRMEWDKDFCSYLEELQKKKPVVLCGDLNVAHQPIDLENPKTNKRNAGFTDEERGGFSALLTKGFLDSFRHLYPDAKKAYTFWTYMMNARGKDVGWRLDYFVLSKSLEANLSDSLIRKSVMGSDHCPIVLLLNL
ncbi:recombination repair protein 1-like [Ornithodoros turicata]